MSAISLLSLRLRVGSAERKGQFAALMPSEAGAHSYGTDSSPTRSRTLCGLNPPPHPHPPRRGLLTASVSRWN